MGALILPPFNPLNFQDEKLNRLYQEITKAFGVVTNAINQLNSASANAASNLSTNFSTTLQTPAAATRTYIAGTRFALGSQRLQIGSMFHWGWSMTKTAAGVAASTIDVAIGSTGTVADGPQISFAKPGGTAAVDEAWCDLYMVVRGPINGNGVIAGEFVMRHNGNNVGHAVIPTVVVVNISAPFDVSPVGLNIGVCITTGAADAITIQVVQAEAMNL